MVPPSTFPATRRGSVVLVVVFSMVVLLGAVAMALDWGRVAVARTQVQAAADAGALAATSSMGNVDVARLRARAFAQAVQANGLVPQVEPGDVSLGFWNGVTFETSQTSPNAARVRAWADVPMTLTRLFGVESVRVQALAGAGPNVVSKRAPDFVLVLDVTGSMSSSELASERTAAKALVNCVKQLATNDSRVALGVFTGVDTVLREMTEIGTGYDELIDEIDDIRGCDVSGMPDCSGTNHAAALGNGLAILEETETPEGVGQVILVMSDGEPNADSICTSSNYTGQGWRPELQAKCANLKTCTTKKGRTTCTQRQPSNSDYLAWVREYNADAEAADIDVYTVYYGGESDGIDYLEDNVRAGDGFSLVAPSASDMTEAFEDICTAYVGQSAGLLF